ncbi:hypothetical protein AK812_SmicGene13926 [Symbiodinium microadriaticum]|uniref:DUF4116 domain-containing protein n=1 Tax=Symbiodinium microadriaticum TaxID=2951 RepID=A0A1Q9E6T8_SYMMI|nr:hypothetical protein AK812_SmicGene13926 [Symbiodinium microadriaticum]
MGSHNLGAMASEDIEIIGAISGEPFHSFKEEEIAELPSIVDLKNAMCRAKDIQSASMLRLFLDRDEDRLPLQDALTIRELRRRAGAPLRLRVLVMHHMDDEEVTSTRRGSTAFHRAQAMDSWPMEHKTDRTRVLAAVKRDWQALKYCLPLFRGPRKAPACRAQAIRGAALALKFASPRLRNDRALAQEALSLDTSCLEFVSEELREDVELMREAVSRNAFALRFAGPRATECKELVLAAVQAEGMALLYAGPEMRADREVVLAAVRQDGCALLCASQVLRMNREVVQEAVRQNGLALQQASEELQADPELRREAEEVHFLAQFNYEI